MMEISVKYSLTDEDEQRLQNIVKEYIKQGLKLPMEKLFEGIMLAGSRYDIDKKFKFHEYTLGLREDYE